jgi:hypothetical protein
MTDRQTESVPGTTGTGPAETGEHTIEMPTTGTIIIDGYEYPDVQAIRDAVRLGTESAAALREVEARVLGT